MILIFQPWSTLNPLRDVQKENSLAGPQGINLAQRSRGGILTLTKKGVQVLEAGPEVGQG